MESAAETESIQLGVQSYSSLAPKHSREMKRRTENRAGQTIQSHLLTESFRENDARSINQFLVRLSRFGPHRFRSAFPVPRRNRHRVDQQGSGIFLDSERVCRSAGQ
jgi:hypothetical protein